ncbi:MAG: type II toxin-antitoxin system Phd/YefM family antitoxin [Chloroflexi bacterium]|nr:type II toxin-antitoxin system Phd/YefM family antitoxin [Chloroflexota bacterium]
MAKTVSTAQAKAQFSALVARVAYGGEQYIIERRGKPLAALVSLDDLDRLERERAPSPRPLGALALVGLLRDLDDAEMDAVVADIYRERERDTGRPVEIEDWRV